MYNSRYETEEEKRRRLAQQQTTQSFDEMSTRDALEYAYAKANPKGGYVTMTDKSVAQKNVDNIMKSAAMKGAEELITACPLCLYNLDANASEDVKLPVHYFTELLAEALGVKE